MRLYGNAGVLINIEKGLDRYSRWLQESEPFKQKPTAEGVLAFVVSVGRQHWCRCSGSRGAACWRLLAGRLTPGI